MASLVFRTSKPVILSYSRSALSSLLRPYCVLTRWRTERCSKFVAAPGSSTPAVHARAMSAAALSPASAMAFEALCFAAPSIAEATSLARLRSGSRAGSFTRSLPNARSSCRASSSSIKRSPSRI
eukprot:scaffold108511_cov33-Tisochrysis_lutea.AAC.3